jgi:hypothetical protein
MTTLLTTEYLSGLEKLLAPAAMRSTSARAQHFLPQSQKMGHNLAAALHKEQDTRARSELAIQLLASAAADLAIVSKLAPETRKHSLRDRSPETIIWQGLKNPAALMQPRGQRPRYRGADRDLLAAIHQTLNSIQEASIETTADGLSAALSMNLTVLRDAAKLAGMDTQRLLKEMGADEVAAFAVAAWEKITLLVGPENADKIQETIGESLEKLSEKTAVTTYVKRFLDTDIIYRESRAIIQAYDGPAAKMARLTPKIIAIEGSFSGRDKIVATLIRLFSLARLTQVLRTPPWGPLISASGYLLLIGYELYSAHDHLGTERFALLDRVTGVRTLVHEQLAPETTQPSS